MPELETVVISPASPATHTVICLHGLGADGNDLVGAVAQLKLSPNLAIRFIFPHAPVRTVSLNGGLPMRAWFDIYGLSIDSAIDYPGLAQSQQQLQQLIQAEQVSGIPLANIVLAGFSQGGALALYTGLHYPQRLGGILALSTFWPTREFTDLQQPKDIPIFMAHGDQDETVIPALALLSRDGIRAQGYTVAWHSYAMAHTLCIPEMEAISDWLAGVVSRKTVTSKEKQNQ